VRLQAWAITLSTYHYDIEFRPTTKHANADGLSRLPLENIPITNADDSASLFNFQQIGILPVDSKQLHVEISKDPILSKVQIYTKEGWPEDVDAQLRPFFRRRLGMWMFNVGYQSHCS